MKQYYVVYSNKITLITNDYEKAALKCFQFGGSVWSEDRCIATCHRKVFTIDPKSNNLIGFDPTQTT